VVAHVGGVPVVDNPNVRYTDLGGHGYVLARIDRDGSDAECWQVRHDSRSGRWQSDLAYSLCCVRVP
jgi:hypothetical protein